MIYHKKSIFDNTFRWTLLFSLFIHIIIFIKVPAFRIATYKTVKQVLEVTYDRLIKGKEAHTQESQIVSHKNSHYTKKLIEDIPLASLDDTVTKPNLLITKKDTIEKTPIVLVDSDKKINIEELRSDVPQSQAYESYNTKMRSAIRAKAYANFSQYQEGHIDVSFVVLKNGTLKDILIHTDKSTPNNYLKDVVLKSIKEAAPFERFPLELDYPQITFSVTISFEVK